jgi:hypothetical protein
MMLLIKNKEKKILTNRYILFHLLLVSLHRNVEIAFQNKNRHLSYSYSLPVGIIITKIKR